MRSSGSGGGKGGGAGGGLRSSAGGKGSPGGSMGGSRSKGSRERVGTVEKIHRTSMNTSDKRVDVKLDDGSRATFEIGLRESTKLSSGKKYAFHLADSPSKGGHAHVGDAKDYVLKGSPRSVAGQDKFKSLRDARRNGDDGGKGGKKR